VNATGELAARLDKAAANALMGARQDPPIHLGQQRPQACAVDHRPVPVLPGRDLLHLPLCHRPSPRCHLMNPTLTHHRWSTWRLHHSGWDACRCGNTFWTDLSGRHAHRVQHGHSATTQEEYVAMRVRVEGLFVRLAEREKGPLTCDNGHNRTAPVGATNTSEGLTTTTVGSR
jgi:hypothetical protein